MPVDLKWENLKSLVKNSMMFKSKRQKKRKLEYKD